MATALFKSLPIVTVATAGTRVPISATSVDRVVAVYISAPAANTGSIYVGDSTTKAITSPVGLEIAKGVSPVKLEYSGAGNYIDLQNIFVDAINTGDKATVSYLILV
jgi:hypothetical protein